MEQSELELYLMELASEGYACSQMLLILALEGVGEENPALVRAMSGLTEGMGGQGLACGALTAGCCFLGYYGGKGASDEEAHPKFQQVVGQFVQWLEEEVGERYGGYNCSQILEEQWSNRVLRCPGIIVQVYEKMMELLDEHGCLS